MEVQTQRCLTKVRILHIISPREAESFAQAKSPVALKDGEGRWDTEGASYSSLHTEAAAPSQQ